jgi:3-deoxy-D-manno-octulosonate 8-phosphate phosphatase (KDO 8-P phosphatase)
LPVLKRVGVSAAPSDAHPEVLKRVDLRLDHPGGDGAVREFIELWLMAAGHWESAMEDMIRGNI